MHDIIFQAAGIGISISLIALAVAVRRTPIIVLTMLVNLLSMLTYAMSGSWSAFAVATITVVYGLTAFFDEKYPVLKHKSVIFAVCAVLLATYAITTPKLVSTQVLVLIGTFSGIFSMALHNQVIVKLVQIVGNVSFMVFAYSIGNYGQIPGQAVCFALLCVSLMYLVAKSLKTNPAAPMSVQHHTGMLQQA